MNNGVDWVRGDLLGLSIPAHAQALRDGGVSFLTEAFRAAGVLAADDRVERITQFEDCPGGSTGRKLKLAVEYGKGAPGLCTQLFVKFSRDFDDVIRDRAKNQLEPEVRLALLSRDPGFPIAVPKCFFADYHQDSGTGILITQRVAFGGKGIEPLYPKCLDYEMPQALQHYQALLKALARLAAAHKSGRLADRVAQQFPFDAGDAAARDRIRYTQAQLLGRVERYADFAARYPQLLPANITSAAFIAQLREDVPRFLHNEEAIRRFLHSNPQFIALCHWNANVDNAWFWRDSSGTLECGLLDWGRVGQMSVALALFGCLSAAERSMWDQDLTGLLAVFVGELQAGGGPALEPEELKFHLLLFVALMGLAWLMDAPALIRAQLPDLDTIESRFDPGLKANETARVQLHMMTNVLNLWQRERFGMALDRFLERMRATPVED